MMLALMLAASSLAEVILPVAILSALRAPVVMLPASIATAFTCVAVSVPVYMPVEEILVSLGNEVPPSAVVMVLMGVVQFKMTVAPNVTFPAASQLMFPPATAPAPVASSLHLNPLIPFEPIQTEPEAPVYAPEVLFLLPR